MPRAEPNRVLDKFRKLHDRIGGSDRPVFFLKFTNAIQDYFKDSSYVTETTTISPQPVIKDQPGEDIAAAFGGGIFSDQRIFIVLADSFQARLPLDTLSQRCEDFILERTGQDRGGILYGSTIYTIERFFAKPILGTVAARYFILARAQKDSSS